MAAAFFFFFSSRRRHTRCSRDWSSDVCSSDLGRRDAGVLGVEPGATGQAAGRHLFPPDRDRAEAGLGGERPRAAAGGIARGGAAEEWRCHLCRRREEEIGRASCWEKVWISGGAGSLKKKK